MIDIRELRQNEHGAWLALRERLWPDSAPEELRREQAGILANSPRNAVFVAATGAGELVGFIEVSTRDWAEGCETSPVGFLEGWYVAPAHRRAGVGRRLVAAAEQWALAHGCVEMGSDAELSNRVSQLAHQADRLSVSQRLVAFSKKLIS